MRCQLFDAAGNLIVENTYWQSQKDDDVGDRANDDALNLKQVAWADMAALNTMPRSTLQVSARHTSDEQMGILLRNPGESVAFFERATISASRDGNEILPIQYDDN